MKPLRWLTIAVVAGCFALLFQPVRANASPSHLANSLGATTLLHAGQGTGAPTRSSQSQNPSRRTPTHPANRSKTHHASNGRGRGNSPYGILTGSLHMKPVDEHRALRLGQIENYGAHLNRMLESRGPPRAGPSWNTVLRGFSTSLPQYLSSSVPNNTPTSSLTRVQPLGPRHAVRLEGAAARLFMPSSGGSFS